MEEDSIRRNPVLIALEQLLREVGTEVGLCYGPQSGTDKVCFGSPIGNRILDPLLMLLL